MVQMVTGCRGEKFFCGLKVAQNEGGEEGDLGTEGDWNSENILTPDHPDY